MATRAADAVLGPEEAGEVKVLARVQEIDDVTELPVDGRGVDEEADALSAERRHLARKDPRETGLEHEDTLARVRTVRPPV